MAREPIIMNTVDFTGLMSPAGVAPLFRISPKTVHRWAVDGQLVSIRTLANSRRSSRAQVEALLHGEQFAGEVADT